MTVKIQLADCVENAQNDVAFAHAAGIMRRADYSDQQTDDNTEDQLHRS